MELNLENFLKYLQLERNYSSYTIINYQEDIQEFFSFIKKDCTDINKDDIRKYLKYLDQLKFKNNTISRKLSSLRAFYKFLLKKNIINNNPFVNIKNPKKEKRIPNFLQYDEFESLINSLKKDDNLSIRNRLILELLYATGLRVGELTNIKIQNIDFANRSIKVLGKGNKERVVYYGDYAEFIINEYINKERLSLLANHQSEYLLINNQHGRLTSRGVEKIIDKIVMESSLKHKISPHVLRHTFATHLLNNGADILSVKELLGHESLKATQIYTHITPEYLRNIYLKTHPRSNKHD